MKERPEIDAYDDWVYDGSIASIPDEMVHVDRAKMGHVTLNRRGIFNMAVRGYNAQDIANVFGTTRQTIHNNFSREIAAGNGMIGPRLKANLLRQAMMDKPNPSILIFALKNYTDLTEDGGKLSEDTGGSNEWKVEPPKFDHKTTLTDSEREEIEGENDD